MIEEFLKTYFEYMKWNYINKEKALYKLCEQYSYSPNDMSFRNLVLGWMWGQSNDYVAATVYSGMLILQLDDVYKKVASKYGWDN